MSVLLETSVGDIVVDLYHQLAPAVSLNFLKLCKLKRYNDAYFYHIERGFIARACDRLQDESKPGAGIYELAGLRPPRRRESNPRITHNISGALSMPSNGTGSQIFLTLAEGHSYLDDTHTVFGAVAEGHDVLAALAAVIVDARNRPYRAVRIRHAIVLHDPFDDPAGMPVAPLSPPPSQLPPPGFLPSDDEASGGAVGEEELREREARREARSRAEVLEMIGDLPDADAKPPDNVLFVCRLNAHTEADDLEIIFSRFGECRADVVRDPKTGKSLNYAFVEFQTAEQCERAYYKMDKALVDDRRIRVDFSQSVSGLWNENRRRRRQARGAPAARHAGSG